MSFTTTATITSFGGKLLKLTHEASSTCCRMALNLYLPPIVAFPQGVDERGRHYHTKVPVLFYLSGLTCTPDNCAEKGFLHFAASQKGIAIVYPDTSPRGLDIPCQDDAHDFGSAASFYIDATRSPWCANYRMETYLSTELPTQLFSAFAELDSSRISIAGHSMGGHGALTLFLKNPGMYKSVSAFAPICNPMNCLWGQKAFAGYLGDNSEDWKKHDATELVKNWNGPLFNCLIDVGTNDQFYKQGQLLPENFASAAKQSCNDQGPILRYQEGYDHSYYFVSSFAIDHINHAAKFLFV